MLLEWSRLVDKAANTESARHRKQAGLKDHGCDSENHQQCAPPYLSQIGSE